MNTPFAFGVPSPWQPHATVFAALGEDYRQRILLLFEPNEELTIKQIVDVLPLSRSAVLHHVTALLNAGLLARRKAGREVFLRVDTGRLASTLEDTLAYLRGSA